MPDPDLKDQLKKQDTDKNTKIIITAFFSWQTFL